MKRCPQCHQTYTDETLKFCRVDGAALQVNGTPPADGSDTAILPSAVTGDALPTQLLQAESAQAQEAPLPVGAARNTRTGKSKAVGEAERRKRSVALASLALLLAALSLGYWSFTRRSSPISSAPTPIESIAVLPFENASGYADLDYLSDGVSESVIDRLSGLPQLKVIARTSSFRYRGADLDLKQIADALGVDAIVTGRVARRDEGYLIRVDVTDVRENKQLWGENFNRKASDVQILQADISREIAENLRLRLSGAQTRQLANLGTTDPQAYELLLRGRFYFNKTGRENFDRAVDYYERAIAIDPNYAHAYAELAEGYNFYGGRGLELKQLLSKQEAAARRLLELDAGLAEAHYAMAEVRRKQWQWREAEREYLRAIELNPNLPQAHRGYAQYLSTLGRHDEAVASARRAAELDPLSLIVNSNLGARLYMARRFDEALAAFQKNAELSPESPVPHHWLGDTYLAKGMNREAVAQFQEAINKRAGDATIVEARIGVVYVRTGERERAEEILRRVESAPLWGAPPALAVTYERQLALLYDALGRSDEAFGVLEKAFAARNPNLPFVAVDPAFDNLRSDPRFRDLVRRMGLSP